MAHKATGILMNKERDSHLIASVDKNERLIPPRIAPITNGANVSPIDPPIRCPAIAVAFLSG